MPGVQRVAHADSFERIAAAALSVGYGFTGGVLTPDEGDTHHRAASSLAVSFRPLSSLAFSFVYDNRYDRHLGVEEGDGTDDGWLAESRVGARYVHRLSDALGLGFEGTVWFPPGGEPPSFDVGGTSFEGLALATFQASPQLKVSGNAGFRYDQSAESVENADMLSAADRLALGVSNFDAVVTGIGASYSFGRFDILAEATWDILVGADSPDISESPLQLGAGVRARATDSIQLQLVVQGSPSRVGDFSPMGSLYRVDPSFSTMFMLSYSYPLEGKDQLDCSRFPSDPRCGGAVEPEKLDPGKVEGVITDEGGNPIPGASLTLVVQPAKPGAQAVTVTAESDVEGKFAFDAAGEPLPDGDGILTARAEGFKENSARVAVRSGKLSRVAVPLQEQLPLSSLEGVIQSFGGKPVAATIEVQPGGKSATADAEDGSFRIDLDPGTYQVTITARGYRDQERTVTIKKNGVFIMNVDMRAE